MFLKKLVSVGLLLVLLCGCAQNTALLGPALSVATNGSISKALVSGSINTGIKHQTGKSINEHMAQSLEQNLDCSDNTSNELIKIFFVNYSDIDCYSQNIK